MSSMDDFVAMFKHPYEAARRYQAGELDRRQLIAILGLWPYEPINDLDDASLQLEASPGSLAHVIRSLDHALISAEEYVAICKLHAEEFAAQHQVDAVFALDRRTSGRWQVTTKHAVHVIDLDERVVTRTPRPGAPRRSAVATTLPLREVESCRVGQNGRWTVDVAFGLRDTAETTVIVSIIRVDADGTPVKQS